MIFEARWSRPRLIFVTVACLGFAGFGLWLAGFLNGGKDVYPAAGWGIAIGSLLAVAIFVRRLWIDDVQLRIDGRGIEWARLDRPIPWHQLTGTGVVVVKNQALLCISLKDPEGYRLANPVARVLARADSALGFGQMGLNVINLDRSFDELVAAVRSWRPDLFQETDRL
jgi:hypothetical protein